MFGTTIQCRVGSTFLLLLVSVNFCWKQSWGAATDDEIQRWLDSHNQYRLKHQVAPVSWSDEVAQSAQNWADSCPTGHSKAGYGENMAWGYSSIESVVTAWYSEEKYYDYSNPGFSYTTGHFTQVVWKATTEIGCALKTGCPSWPTTWVCQYNPPGNYLGRFAENVFPVRVTPPVPPPKSGYSPIPVINFLLDKK